MQKDLSAAAEFAKRFATEAACRDYLIQLRWPEGFRCPHCGAGANFDVLDGAVAKSIQHRKEPPDLAGNDEVAQVAEWLPEGALYHDPNAYLKSERSKDVVALV